MSLCPIEKKFVDASLEKHGLYGYLKAVIRYAHHRKPDEKHYDLVEREITKHQIKGGPD